MTRINTNVSSLNAQKSLVRANAQLEQSLTRLSTGLRINSGRDDPAGLIASEVLRSDMIATEKAITNTQRANQMIATADSAIGQATSLLNDIRGLITESTNEGALSPDQLAANQLQIDSSLEALNRIAQTTTFQGKKLLDGSLDFTTQPGGNFGAVLDLEIQQANLGTAGQVDVDVQVTAAATKASVTNNSVAAGSDSIRARGEMVFTDPTIPPTAAAQATLDVTLTDTNAITVSALAGGTYEQSAGNGITVKFDENDQSLVHTAAYDGGANTLTITVGTDGQAWGDEIVWGDGADGGLLEQVNTALGADFDVAAVAAGAYTVGTDAKLSTMTATLADTTSTFTVSARSEGSGGSLLGAAGDVNVVFLEEAVTTDHTAAYDGGTNTLTITIGTGVLADGATISLTAVGEILDDLNALQGVGEVGLDFTFSGTGDYTVLGGGGVPPGDEGALGTLAGGDTSVVGALGDTITGEDANANGVYDAVQATTALTLADASTFTVSALEGGAYEASAGNDIEVVFNEDINSAIHTATLDGSTLTVNVGTEGMVAGDTIDAGDLANAVKIDLGEDFDAVATGDYTVVTDAAETGTLAGGVDAILAQDSITVAATDAGVFANGIEITVVEDEDVVAGTAIAEMIGQAVQVKINGATSIDTIAAAIDDMDEFTAFANVEFSILGYDPADQELEDAVLAGGSNSGQIGATSAYADVELAVGLSTIRVQSTVAGAAENGTTVEILDEDPGVASGEVQASVGTDGTLTVKVGVGGTTEQVLAAINGTDGFTAEQIEGLVTEGVDASSTSELAGGSDAQGGLTDTLVLEIGGTSGSEVFQFEVGALVDEMVTAVNLVSDSTGVEAVNNAGSLEFRSAGYGSEEFVSLNVLEEGANGTFAANLSDTRAYGTDVDAKVNGVQANARGNSLSINTSTLDLSMTIGAESTDDISFSIAGGGALFQIGPEVVSNQQVRLGIQSLSTGRLGGVAGKLFELGSGGRAALDGDANVAAAIVGEAINVVTSLRGRLGAFQRTTLETNAFTLEDTLEALTAAESSIRDTDFATETAQLTRSQILVQSGVSVLSIANSTPQNALALLR